MLLFLHKERESSFRNKTNIMMMIMGGGNIHSNPTVQVPPWDDPMDQNHHHRCNQINPVFFDDLEMLGYDDVLEYDDDVVNSVNSLNNVPLDVFSGDHFRMYEFKVRRCARGRSHDWTDCPYAHPGEKARRRDPRKFHYAGNPCPEFRKGSCVKGDTCDFAHGVFECWLHPSRYRTQPCKDGVHCRRRICFFAHTPEQLRVLSVSQPGLSQPDSYDGSPSRFSLDSLNSLIGKSSFGSSPTSTLYHLSSHSSPHPSPPMSPIGQTAVNELTSSVRNMQISNSTRLCLNSVTGSVPGSGLGTPRSLSTLRPGQNQTSSSSTPTRNPFDMWDEGVTREEPVMERVESGKEIRAKMYAKLSRENSLVGRVESTQNEGWFLKL